MYATEIVKMVEIDYEKVNLILIHIEEVLDGINKDRERLDALMNMLQKELKGA